MTAGQARRRWLHSLAGIGGVRIRLPLAAAVGGCRPALGPLQGRFEGPDPALGHRLRGPSPASTPGAQPDAPQLDADVVVVGAGIAGLTAARTLARAGLRVHLLEMEPAAGGNARGSTIGGFPAPLGAHYLPIPGPSLPDLQALLGDWGLLARGTDGVWHTTPAGERHRIHAPQERLHHHGRWQEGLLPLEGASAGTRAQFQQMADHVNVARSGGGFRIPVAWDGSGTPGSNPGHRALDQRTFAQWLDAAGLDDPALRAYLDYCCRDDYGADSRTVSAWAGLHYFAARSGLVLPGDGLAALDSEPGVFTWPEGNQWLVNRFIQDLDACGAPVETGWLVRTVVQDGNRVRVTAQSADGVQPALRTVWASHALLAVPLMVADRLVPEGAEPWRAALARAARQPRAAWVTANLLIEPDLESADAFESGRAPDDAPPSWDNVIMGAAGLGYVDARHQELRRRAGPSVLTWYHALGSAPAARAALLSAPWQDWAALAQTDLVMAHPDLPWKLRRVQVTRWAHAMACPVPGVHCDPDLAALQARPTAQGILFAHADLSGYSIFEEAHAQGMRAARQILAVR